MFSLTKILNRLYLTKFSFYLLLALILISFSITFYLMLPNNNLVKNPLQLQYFLLADVLFVVLCLANQTGVDLQQSFSTMMEMKAKRDHKRHHSNRKLK